MGQQGAQALEQATNQEGLIDTDILIDSSRSYGVDQHNSPKRRPRRSPRRFARSIQHALRLQQPHDAVNALVN